MGPFPSPSSSSSPLHLSLLFPSSGVAKQHQAQFVIKRLLPQSPEGTRKSRLENIFFFFFYTSYFKVLEKKVAGVLFHVYTRSFSISSCYSLSLSLSLFLSLS